MKNYAHFIPQNSSNKISVLQHLFLDKSVQKNLISPWIYDSCLKITTEKSQLLLNIVFQMANFLRPKKSHKKLTILLQKFL